MSLFSTELPIPQRRAGPEYLDLPPEAYRLEELEGSLADIRAVNRYLGDRQALMKHLAAGIGKGGSFSVLDVATGSADLPVAIADWARKTGISAGITGVDINERTIGVAHKQTAGYPEITLRVADGLNLPFPDKSFDFVFCCKTAHHLTDGDNVRLIQEMMRVAKQGYFVIDLRRSWVAWGLIYALTRLLTRNRLTRHDAPLSVLKAFTPGEFAALASRAGAGNFTVSREPFWLLVLSGAVT